MVADGKIPRLDASILASIKHGQADDAALTCNLQPLQSPATGRHSHGD